MMEYFAVEGGWPLEGQVPVHGAKNSALPILAATLLADGESIIHNCPSLTDCAAALEILSCLGCRVRREGETVVVNTACRRGHTIPDDLMGPRSSFWGRCWPGPGRPRPAGQGGVPWGPGPLICTFRPSRPWAPRGAAGMASCFSMRQRGCQGAGSCCPSPVWGPRKMPCWPPAAPGG